jgi:hypothetical protein
LACSKVAPKECPQSLHTRQNSRLGIALSRCRHRSKSGRAPALSRGHARQIPRHPPKPCVPL